MNAVSLPLVVFDVFGVRLLELQISESRQLALGCSLIDGDNELLSVTEQIQAYSYVKPRPPLLPY
jgi:hypothetical protein